MTLQPFGIRSFGGLELRSEPDEVGPQKAIDLLNVEIDKVGAVRSRRGHRAFTAVPSSSAYTQMGVHYKLDSGVHHLLATRADGAVDALGNTGTVLATQAKPANWERSPYNYASIGTPGGGDVTYGGYRSGAANKLLKWDGSAFSLVASTYGAVLVAVQSSDNRLVIGNLNDPGKSSIRFSDPGAPETFSANSYVTLSPGDGEEITGLCPFGEDIFAFKNTKFYVFYGNSVDGTGNPVFNYRPVLSGVGAASNVANGTVSYRTWTVGTDGVYFLSNSGVYRTTGGTPQLVSGPLTPLFRTSADLPPFYQGSVVNQDELGVSSLAWANGRLYCAVPTGSSATNDTMLVYDPAQDYWTVWNIPATGLQAYNPSSGERLAIAHGATSSISTYPAGTTDAGALIPSHYRSGFYNPTGDASITATIRESTLRGIGSPTFSVSAWPDTLLPTTGGGAKATVSLGTSPSYAEDRHRVDQQAKLVSYQIEATSPWLVGSIVQSVRSRRPEGIDAG